MLRQSEEIKRKATRLLTRKDLSERLQISPRTVSRMICDRRLPQPLLIGRGIRWPEDEIEAWLEDAKRGA